MPCPVRRPSGDPVSNRCNLVPPRMLTTTSWNICLLGGLLIRSTRKHSSMINDVVATHLCYQC